MNVVDVTLRVAQNTKTAEVQQRNHIFISNNR